jgi:hypothetical protein
MASLTPPASRTRLRGVEGRGRLARGLSGAHFKSILSWRFGCLTVRLTGPPSGNRSTTWIPLRRLRSNRLLGRCFAQDEPRPAPLSAFRTDCAVHTAPRWLGARRGCAVAPALRFVFCTVDGCASPARHKFSGPTLPFSGAVSGNKRPMRTALHGLRCNGLLGGVVLYPLLAPRPLPTK